jgi:hypothetical protein
MPLMTMKPDYFVSIGVLCSLVVLLSCRSMNEDGQSAKYPLLRSLQGTVNRDDPRELLSMVVAQDPPKRENPREIPPWQRLANPLKHEALMRLLELQVTHFAGRPFKPTDEGTGIDSIAVWVKATRQDRVEIVATPTWKPIRSDVTGAQYYVLELLEFSRDGRLTTRQVYSE